MKDLNLLRVFEAIWYTRSVSKAAERLGLTQPAVSSALARLRKSYSDPLFTRAGSQMAPTAFCSQQAHFLLDALALVQRSLSDVQVFNSATSTREFVLGMLEIGEATLLPPVIAHCRKAAPGVRFRTALLPLEVTGQKLDDGRVDLAIGFLPALEAGIHRRELFSQHYVCVMRSGHPLLARRLRLVDVADADHIAIEHLGTGHSLVERQIKEQGLDRRIALRTPHYMSAVHVLAVTDLVCLMPEMLARTLKDRYDVEYREIPVKVMRFPIALYWHDRFHRDPGNQWLRSVFVKFHGSAGVAPGPT